MKKPLFFMLLFGLSLWTHAQTQRFSLGNFSFFLSPKILKEGAVTDFGFGLNYSEQWGGELRLRFTNIAENEELIGVADSINAKQESIFEIFLLPAEYSFFRSSGKKAWLAFGAYYEYDKLSEKGFFNMPSLENLSPPRERVNSYTNEFSMHVAGPLIDLGFFYAIKGQGGALPLLDINFSGGIAPVFFLASSQKMGIVPLLDPDYAEYDQQTWGSPYCYVSLDTVILKYVNLVLLYDFSRLKYQVIDFDDNLNWIRPEQTAAVQSFKIEASLLIPLGFMWAQIGYGYSLGLKRFNDEPAITENRHYIILTVKKDSN